MLRLVKATNSLVALFTLVPTGQAFAPKVRLYSSSSALKMSKRVLVPIGDGSEEIETTCITDTLTRFGAEVTIASVMPGEDLTCKMSRGIKVTHVAENEWLQMFFELTLKLFQVVADLPIVEAANEEWDLVALPGGMPGE